MLILASKLRQKKGSVIVNIVRIIGKESMLKPQQLPSQLAQSHFQGEPTASSGHSACVSSHDYADRFKEYFEADKVSGDLFL